MHPTARKFRDTIDRGHPAFGTMLVEFTGPAVVSTLVNAGFDFVILDGEHGNLNPREMEATIEAGYQSGLPVIVRPPNVDRGMITRSLDAGAAGVLIPFVSSMDYVAQAVRASKYTPLGKRGSHFMRGHTRHRPPDALAFMAEANRDLLTCIQIELADAVPLVEQIAATEGVDLLYIGPGDLSVDLGIPGRWDAPEMLDIIGRAAEACRRHGKILACHVASVAGAAKLRPLGVQVFGLEADIVLFQAAVAECAAEFRQTFPREGP